MAAGIGSGLCDVVVEPQPQVTLRTDDGGASWREVRLSGGYRARAIDFAPGGKRGWIAAERCVSLPEQSGCPSVERALFRSDDGGASWGVVAPDLMAVEMRFVSAAVGWASAAVCPQRR